MTVKITRLVLSPADLREAAGRSRDAKAARRMLAIALVLDGWSREAAAEACGMDRQTLRDWVHRYNEFGLDGLHDRPRRDVPLPHLSAEQQAKVAEWVEQGPELERDGVVRWRCVDLQRRIKAEFNVALHEMQKSRLNLTDGVCFGSTGAVAGAEQAEGRVGVPGMGTGLEVKVLRGASW